jgi:hypothetical protein
VICWIGIDKIGNATTPRWRQSWLLIDQYLEFASKLMDLAISLSKTVTTACADGYQRFFHGTLANNVGGFYKGINFDACGGEFWATSDLENARYFAFLAEQQLLFANGIPGQAIFAFNLPLSIVDTLQGQQPEPWLWVYSHGYKFTPACSEILNNEMTNIEITFEE